MNSQQKEKMKIKQKKILFVPAALVLIPALVWIFGLFSKQVVWADLTDMDEDREVYLMPSSYISLSDGQKYGCISRGPYLRLPPGKYRLQWRIIGDGDNRIQLSSGNNAKIEPSEFILPKEESMGSFEFTLLDAAEGFDIGIYFDEGTEIEVEDLRLYSPFYRDHAFSVLFVSALLIGIWLYFQRGGKRTNLAPLAMIGVAVLFSSALSLKESVTLGHDTPFHWERFYNLANGIAAGQFPVRLGTYVNNGYGSITSVFYPDIFLYPGAVMLLLGASGNYVYNVYLFALNLLSGLSMYFCAKRIFGDRWTGAIAAILYILVPYHITDLYLRQALGEAAAMSVLPIFFLGLWEVVFEDDKMWPLLSVGASLVYVCHMLTTVLCAAFALGFCLLYFRQFTEKSRITAILKAILLSCGLCLWHLLPMIGYMAEGIGASELITDISNFAIEPATLFLWRFGDRGGTAERTMNGLPIEPGIVLWIGVFIVFYLYLVRGTVFRNAWRCAVPGGICLIATLTLFPWHRLSTFVDEIGYIQFPWRIMVLVTLLFSLTAADGYRKLYPDASLTILAVLTLSLMLIMPSITDKAQTKENIRYGETVFPEALYTEYTLPNSQVREGLTREIHTEPDLIIEEVKTEKNSTQLFFAKTSDITTITFPRFAFTGYRAKLNGEEIPIQRGENECVMVSIPEDTSGKIEVWFAGMWWWRIGEIVSLISILVLFFIVQRQRQNLNAEQ